MNDIKTDLFPEKLRAGKKNGHGGNDRKDEQRNNYSNAVTPTEPLPESSRPRKDGPGGD